MNLIVCVCIVYNCWISIYRFFASDSCKEEDDEDTPLGSQHRLLSRLTSIAKQLKFERNTPPVNPAVPSTENSSHRTDATSGSSGHDDRQLSVSSTPPDRQSTMDCAIHQPHCATGESTKANTSESSTSVVMHSPQHSSGPAPHRGGASVRKSLQQFQFSPPTSEVNPTTPVGASILKRRPSSPQPADSNPSKRFLSQEDLVSTGIGYLEKVELLKREGHALSGSEGQDGSCLLDTTEVINHRTTIDTWDSTTNNRDTTSDCVNLETFDPVDLTTEADERVTPTVSHTHFSTLQLPLTCVCVYDLWYADPKQSARKSWFDQFQPKEKTWYVSTHVVCL